MIIIKKIILLVTIMFLLNHSYITAYGESKPNSIKPQIGGKAGIVLEANTNKILYEKNINEKMPMASTTKILTAILAIEKGKLNEMVTIPYEASVVEGSQIWLESGEKEKLEDLLYGLMLRSGNDAAIAIAQHIGGSLENFSKMMNQKAREIGAKNSNFTNPHGLDNPNHYTTAYDLALISSYAIKNNDFQKIVSAKRWTMPWPGHEYNRVLINKNKLIFQYPDCIGIKIGFTKHTGRCLVAGAKRGDMVLVSVVLNDGNWWEDSKKLLDFGFNNYNINKVLKKGDCKRKVTVLNGLKNGVTISNSDACFLVTNKGEKTKISFSYKLKTEKKILAPVIKNQVLGEMKVYNNGEYIKTIPLTAEEGINAKKKLPATKKFIENYMYMLKNL